MPSQYIKNIFMFIALLSIATPYHVTFGQYNHIEAQIYKFQPHNKIKARIGIKSQNRISFESSGIREIIGDNSLYQIIHDSRGYNIFMIPKVEAGEIIEITIISNSNKVQDLSLKVEDNLGQTIIIRS